MTIRGPGSNETRRVAAFTLVEVVLAIVIAVGILVVALFFYQQASNFRDQLLEESERISTARLLMEKMTTEFRTAHNATSFRQPLRGSSNSVQFIRTDVPSLADWRGGILGRSIEPETDLKLVSYRLDAADSTNVTGLIRSEQPLVDLRKVTEDGGFVETNSPANPEPVFLTKSIRFLQFRYWNGSDWQETWNAPELPKAVEVSLAAEPAPEITEGETNAYPAEVFRRVICLPATGGPRLDLPSFTPSPTDDPATSETP